LSQIHIIILGLGINNTKPDPLIFIAISKSGRANSQTLFSGSREGEGEKKRK